MSINRGLLFVDPVVAPLGPLNTTLALATLVFQNSRLSGGGVTGYVPTIYQNAALTSAFPSNTITANSSGQFPVIYLPPVGVLRVQLFNAAGQLLGDVDPFVPVSRFDNSTIVNVFGGGVTVSSTTISALSNPQVYVPYPGTYRFKAVMNWSAPSLQALLITPFFTTMLGLTLPLTPNSAGAYRDGFASSYIAIIGYGGTGQISGGNMSNGFTSHNAPTVLLYTIAAGSNNQLEFSGVFTSTAPGIMAIYAGLYDASPNATMLPGSYMQVQKLK